MKLLCDLNHNALGPTARRTFDQIEQWEMERQQRIESEALGKITEGKEAEAVALLQQFINENCERVDKEYRALNQSFLNSFKAQAFSISIRTI